MAVTAEELSSAPDGSSVYDAAYQVDWIKVNGTWRKVVDTASSEELATWAKHITNLQVNGEVRPPQPNHLTTLGRANEQQG